MSLSLFCSPRNEIRQRNHKSTILFFVRFPKKNLGLSRRVSYRSSRPISACFNFISISPQTFSLHTHLFSLLSLSDHFFRSLCTHSLSLSHFLSAPKLHLHRTTILGNHVFNFVLVLLPPSSVSLPRIVRSLTNRLRIAATTTALAACQNPSKVTSNNGSSSLRTELVPLNQPQFNPSAKNGNMNDPLRVSGCLRPSENSLRSLLSRSLSTFHNYYPSFS